MDENDRLVCEKSSVFQINLFLYHIILVFDNDKMSISRDETR